MGGGADGDTWRPSRQRPSDMQRDANGGGGQAGVLRVDIRLFAMCLDNESIILDFYLRHVTHRPYSAPLLPPLLFLPSFLPSPLPRLNPSPYSPIH